MITNPNVEIVILEHIQSYLQLHGSCKIKDIFLSYNSPVKVTKSELINTVNSSIRKGYLRIIKQRVPREDSIVVLEKPFRFDSIEDKISIVISKPRFRGISLENFEHRNNQIDSITCFREIITSTRQVLRICSPFLQKNVLSEDSFPELTDLLMGLFRKNIEIRILSRELFKGRGEHLQWVVDIADSLDKRHNLKIVDYHFESENGSIISSTHAKILVADSEIAYVGSAELRMNSLVANFEVGCMIQGLQVFGICEVFDFMFSQGRKWV
jgi:hypothetical protein